MHTRRFEGAALTLSPSQAVLVWIEKWRMTAKWQGQLGAKGGDDTSGRRERRAEVALISIIKWLDIVLGDQ